MEQGAGDRWVEVSPSQFTHEAEGLALVRAILPDESPFRAWSNFEFRDSRGRWHEVDLLLLGRGRLHLIELKFYSGILRGDDHNWIREGKRPEDSPLKLARRKAQYFASKLTDELRAWAAETNFAIPNERDVVPFVQESVFLHHPGLTCALPTPAPSTSSAWTTRKTGATCQGSPLSSWSRPAGERSARTRSASSSPSCNGSAWSSAGSGWPR